MKQIAPDYFESFACIAGECRHSCCKGWEIDIDEETFDRYRRIPGAIGERILSAIDQDEDGTRHFHLTEDERCPFLDKNGLCSLILSLGEESLCQICRDHPRFRNFLTDRDEIGLGMCCEAAARLILGKEEKTKLLLLEDDGGTEAPDETESALLVLRDRLFDIVQDRTRSLNARVEQMLSSLNVCLPECSMSEWASFFLTLERLDDSWAKELENVISTDMNEPLPMASGEWDTAFEQLAVYLLYRHFPGALRDGRIEERGIFIALSLHMIYCMLKARALRQGEASSQDLADICRMFSAEIEYSDVNTDMILDRIDELLS